MCQRRQWICNLTSALAPCDTIKILDMDFEIKPACKDACVSTGNACANDGHFNRRCICQCQQSPWIQSKMHVPLCQCRQFPWVQLKMHVPTPTMHKPTSALALCGPVILNLAQRGPGIFWFYFDINANLFPLLSAMGVDGYPILTFALIWIQPWLFKYSTETVVQSRCSRIQISKRSLSSIFSSSLSLIHVF